jgi:hypothetical protein
MKRENMTKKKMDAKGKPPQCLILSRREFFCKKAFFLLNRIFRFISFISQPKDAMLRECVGTSQSLTFRIFVNHVLKQ